MSTTRRFLAALAFVYLAAGSHEATAGVIAVECFNGFPPPGLSGPSVTGICAMVWAPGGTGTAANFTTTSSASLPTGAVGNTIKTEHNINTPPAGEVFRHIARICVSTPTVVGNLSALGLAKKQDGLMWLPTMVDDGITGGTYPRFCPQPSGGSPQNQVIN